MKRSILLAGLALLTLAACQKTPKTDPQPVDFSRYAVRLEPVVTRATETNFESGDAIGLTITRTAGAYATNEKLTYDGSAFSGSLNWYSEGTDEATLKAYYPYIDTEDLPTRFTVRADQSKGTASSDFISAVKEGVLPSANAVSVVFKHRLSRLVVTVKNNSGADIEKVSFKEIIPVALIDENLTAKVDMNAKWQEITAFGKDDKNPPPNPPSLPPKTPTTPNHPHPNTPIHHQKGGRSRFLRQNRDRWGRSPGGSPLNHGKKEKN